MASWLYWCKSYNNNNKIIISYLQLCKILKYSWVNFLTNVRVVSEKGCRELKIVTTEPKVANIPGENWRPENEEGSSAHPHPHPARVMRVLRRCCGGWVWWEWRCDCSANYTFLWSAKIWKIRMELNPDRAWGDAALCSRDFGWARVSLT